MSNQMPALFIGHGSPMNTLEHNGFTAAWQALGRELPRPRALLVISAHWYFGTTAVTAMPDRARSTTSMDSRRNSLPSTIRRRAHRSWPSRSRRLQSRIGWASIVTNGAWTMARGAC